METDRNTLIEWSSENLKNIFCEEFVDLTNLYVEYFDEEARNMVVAAQEKEVVLHTWDSKYMLPSIKDFHNILVHGVNESWKIILREMTAYYDFKLYLNEVNNYLLLVVSAIFELETQIIQLLKGAQEFAAKIKKILLSFKSKPTLLITGQNIGGYVAQIMLSIISYEGYDKKGKFHFDLTRKEEIESITNEDIEYLLSEDFEYILSEDFSSYTVLFDSIPYFDVVISKVFLKSMDQPPAVTNLLKSEDELYYWNKYCEKKIIKNASITFDQNAITLKHLTSEGLVEWNRKDIPASFFTVKMLGQLREYQFLAPMCPELVEKIPKFRLLDSYIFLEDENVTPEEFIPRTNQVLSKFKDVIDSEIFADKHLKELYEVLTDNTREDTHCFIMNEEGKRTVQQWQDGTVIRGCQSYNEMRFYACLYYNSIQNCYYCSYEKFMQINAETINYFALKTKPTIILIVDKDQNIQFHYKTYKNMKVFYMVLEPDVVKTNSTLHASILNKNSQDRLKTITLNYFGVDHLQESRIFEIYAFRFPGKQKKPFYVDHAIHRKNSTETFESATELINRIKNGEPKFVVISGKTGIGKSTTLKKIAYELQQKQTNFWIAYLDFSQIEVQLSEANHALDSEVAAVKLIRNVVLDKLNGNKEVLRKCFDHKVKIKEMVLLIDSVDQISPKYRTEANNLMKLLRQTELQMILTTCLHESNNFSEEESFELHRFNSKRKEIKFIEKIYKTLKAPVPAHYRAWFEKISCDVSKEHWNTPLSLVMVVYLYDTTVQFPGKQDLFRDLLNSLIKVPMSDEQKPFQKLLQILAIRSVFPDDELEDENINKISDYYNFINSGDAAKVGSDFKTANFQQRPFADFLIASIFMYQHIDKNSIRLSIEQQKSVLMDEKHSNIRKVICEFIHRTWKDIKIAQEVIKGNEKKLLRLVIEEDCFKLFLQLKKQLKVAHDNYVMETSDSAEKINLLYLALEKSSKVFLRELLYDGAAFESVLQEEFVFLKAVEKKLYEEVRLHFEKLKKDINKADDRGYVPLHYVAKNGSEKMLKFLIANGANLNQANASNQTALYFAIQANSRSIVKILKTKGVDTKYALKWAAELGQRVLFELFNRQDTNEDGLKKIRIQEALSSAAANGYLEICRRLLELEGEPTAIDKEGETSVHLAADGGHLECVQLLLKKENNFDLKNFKGETPLMKALLNDQEEVVEWFLERNANLQAEDNNGTKVFHHMAAFVLSITMQANELDDFTNTC